MTNAKAFASPPDRWNGTEHSPARAIAKALRILQSEDVQQEPLTVGEYVSICSELLFRATGERIRPKLDALTATMTASMIFWCDVDKMTPDNGDLVLVRLSDGTSFVSYYLAEDKEGNGHWSSDECCGLHPGNWYDHETGKEGRYEVVAWADLPQDINVEGHS